MILIRADANEKIGIGHVMRCIAIARALEQRGEQVCFVTADEGGAAILEAKGQRYRILHSDYRDMEGELPELLSLAAQEKPYFFLADSYFVTPRYLREIRRVVPVGILDDKVCAELSAELLINYNIFADASLYAPGNCCGEYLLGTDYVPLREEFQGIDYAVREQAKTVLITTGGSDCYNIAGQLLEKVLADPAASALRYFVVSGAYNEHLTELEKLAGAHSNLCICRNVGDMSRLMQESDIAVSAGGSTLYELSAVGVPIICFSFVDNQERIVKSLAEKGLTCFGGDYLRQGEAMLDQAADHIKCLAADAGLRRLFSGRLRKLVDGRGAARIAEKLCTWRNG